MRALLTRIKRLEVVHAIERRPPIELQTGYLKKLPEEYAGERHVVTVGRDADGKYRFEERPGAPPTSEDSSKWIIRNILVRPKDGRPDYSWPEDAHVWKAVGRRLDRLEDRLAPQGKKLFLIVVTNAGQKLALDSSRCVQILREAGYLDTTSPISVVDLWCSPDGLNAAELEKYLREHGTRPRCA